MVDHANISVSGINYFHEFFSPFIIQTIASMTARAPQTCRDREYSSQDLFFIYSSYHLSNSYPKQEDHNERISTLDQERGVLLSHLSSAPRVEVRGMVLPRSPQILSKQNCLGKKIKFIFLTSSCNILSTVS